MQTQHCDSRWYQRDVLLQWVVLESWRRRPYCGAQIGKVVQSLSAPASRVVGYVAVPSVCRPCIVLYSSTAVYAACRCALSSVSLGPSRGTSTAQRSYMYKSSTKGSIRMHVLSISPGRFGRRTSGTVRSHTCPRRYHTRPGAETRRTTRARAGAGRRRLSSIEYSA